MKTCKGCGKSEPDVKFRRCCDSYSGKPRWTRNICTRCQQMQRLGKRMRQFTPGQPPANNQ